MGVPPPLWKPLFTDWADASSPPHLLTGASTVCYRGGQSDELSGSQLSTLPSSTTLFAAPDRNLTKSQNSKVEINKSSLLPSLPQTGSSPSSPKLHHHSTPPSRSYSSLHLALPLLPQPVSSTTTTSRSTTTRTKNQKKNITTKHNNNNKQFFCLSVCLLHQKQQSE